MTNRIPFTNRLARRSHVLSLVAILLTLGAVSWGQQSQPGQQGQPGMPRRTPRAPRVMVIQLPQPVINGDVSLEKALRDEQMTALPSDQRLQFPQIGQLAWAAQGVRFSQAAAAGAAPSSASPALKLFFVLPDGVYGYNPIGHSLEQVVDGDARQAMAATLPGGAVIGGVQIVLAGSQRDFSAQYGPRARTGMLLAAGQTAQSIQLEAVSLGLAFVNIDDVNANVARRVIRLSKAMEPVCVIYVGYPAGQAPAAVTTPLPVSQPAPKKALLVVAPQGFQDQELAETKRALEYAGVTTAIASTRLGPLQGVLGTSVDSMLLINQANVADYGAVIFIGGPGIADYLNNPTVQNLARQAIAQRRVLAAIGTAPSILANAGALRGVVATGFVTEQAKMLQGGAKYTGNPVEKDGLIVTATNALATPLFVQAVVEALSQAG
jgi:protease I